LAEVFGLFFGTAALHVQLHSMAAAVSFMTKYSGKIAFPAPILVPQHRWMRRPTETLAGVANPL